ncbi:uncharacterized protein LOC113773594 [Coffea eugenioides]|uniref:uncharacterized protein LOC113773594 n=1 Tax=Coffea eugenioides TaxID=49369 RepID=UPI000F60A4BB|nr:uncharacterized protein LOC113773594 [Coffea eugenioides]
MKEYLFFDGSAIYICIHMATSHPFQASLCPTLRARMNTRIIIAISTPFSITASISNFMLKKQLSSFAPHFLSHNTRSTSSSSIKSAKLLSHTYTTLNPKFSSPSRPLPIPSHPRRLHSFRILAMAEQSSQTTSTSQQQSHRHANRLAAEHSPYLLQHAHNPVDWYPWGEEAFSEARKRDVPIFLSIGYSTCHWCHVMEVESFEDEGVAELLNDWFVSIKVYMTYVQALHGGGGWPLSVFLSPDLKPLMGGTYFPPEDKYGRPGFKTILRGIKHPVLYSPAKKLCFENALTTIESGYHSLPTSPKFFSHGPTASGEIRNNISFGSDLCTKVKEAWDKKKDMLVSSGAFAMEQLAEALTATAGSNKLPDGLPQTALNLCAEQTFFS